MTFVRKHPTKVLQETRAMQPAAPPRIVGNTFRPFHQLLENASRRAHGNRGTRGAAPPQPNGRRVWNTEGAGAPSGRSSAERWARTHNRVIRKVRAEKSRFSGMAVGTVFKPLLDQTLLKNRFPIGDVSRLDRKAHGALPAIIVRIVHHAPCSPAGRHSAFLYRPATLKAR